MQTTRYRRLAATLLASVAVAATNDAHAFPTASAVAPGCHEDMTMRALRAVREVRPEAKPLAPVTRDDRAFIDDLPFDVDGDMTDLGAVTLLNGVRFNDLYGNAPNEVDELAQVHGDAARQREHCLRAPDHDEPAGSEAALRECRGFIREKIADALGGLDASGAPDVGSRVNMTIDLSLRGQVDVPVPRFYARLGEALHAVQDGFTHTYRAGEDRTRVTVVLSYVEGVEGSHVEERDGPAHSSELDRCDVDDPMRVRNVQLATQATIDLLLVVLDSQRNKEQKLAEVDVVLDRYFTYEPGCNAANGWCNAPEKQLATSRCDCSTVGAGGSAGWAIGALALGAGGLAIRRRRRRLASLAAVIAFVVCPSIAHAHEEAPSPEAAEEMQKEQRHLTKFGLHVAGAGSISNPGAAAMAGLRLRLGERWVFGVDGEWNGWYGINSGRMRTGAINVYGTAILRFPMKWEVVNLRSAVQLGMATQVVDLVGAPSGTTGIFAGFNPLGLEWRLSGAVFAILYPIGVALPVTQLSGAPFAYPQYRTSLGIEVSF